MQDFGICCHASTGHDFHALADCPLTGVPNSHAEIVPKKIQAAVALARMEPKEQQPKQQQAQPSAT